MAARGYEFYLRVLKVYFQHEKIKFVSPSGHVMFCLLCRYCWNVQIVFSFSKWWKSGHQPLKHACCATWNKIWKLWKANHDNVKFCNKNVNVVERHYTEAQKYLTMKTRLAFYWLIVFVTTTTPISSHVKDKNDNYVHCARWRYDFLVKGEILVFHQYLYNNSGFRLSIVLEMKGCDHVRNAENFNFSCTVKGINICWKHEPWIALVLRISCQTQVDNEKLTWIHWNYFNLVESAQKNT